MTADAGMQATDSRTVAVDAGAAHRRAARLEAQVAALEQLLEVTERTVAEQSDHLETALRELDARNHELRRSNDELETFAYVASHDLQEPLRMVASYSQLIARRYSDKLDDAGREFIQFAVDGATRMQLLIEALLEYSRVGSRPQAFDPVHLDAVVEAVLSDLRLRVQETDAHVTHDPLPTVMGDKTQLTQLFQNLVSNALKFRGNNPARVHIASERGTSEWILSVRDDGIGIDAKYSERIFQIFQRLHTRDEYPGTGIGLAVCRRIVERHNGRIWVEPVPGAGSVFKFTIPLNESIK